MADQFKIRLSDQYGMALTQYMAPKYVRNALVLLGAAVTVFALIFGYLLVRYEILGRDFRQIYPDDSEAQLLKVVGAPTSIRGCVEGVHKYAPDGSAGTRKCAKVYWYSTYIFTDGWLIPIDDTGHIIQIRRLALP